LVLDPHDCLIPLLQVEGVLAQSSLHSVPLLKVFDRVANRSVQPWDIGVWKRAEVELLLSGANPREHVFIGPTAVNVPF